MSRRSLESTAISACVFASYYPKLCWEKRIYQMKVAHCRALAAANQIGRLLGKELASEEQIDIALRTAEPRDRGRGETNLIS